MVVLFVEHVPPSIRGELTRWMLEPHAGVFVGKISTLVRERLWDKLRRDPRCGAAVIIYACDTEQGYTFETLGDPTRTPVDFDGLTLIRLN